MKKKKCEKQTKQTNEETATMREWGVSQFREGEGEGEGGGGGREGGREVGWGMGGGRRG